MVNSWKGLAVYCKAGVITGLSSPLLPPGSSPNAFRKATHVGDSPPFSTSAKPHLPASLGSPLGHDFLVCKQTAPTVVTQGPKPHWESHGLPATTHRTPQAPSATSWAPGASAAQAVDQRMQQMAVVQLLLLPKPEQSMGKLFQIPLLPPQEGTNPRLSKQQQEHSESSEMEVLKDLVEEVFRLR